MRTLVKLILTAGTLFWAGTVLGQAPMNIRVGNATANDAQAAMNAFFAEHLTKNSGGRFKASSHPGSALGTNAQMLSTLQAGALQVMVIPTGFLAAAVPEMGLFDMPFLLPGEPAKITAFTAKSKAAAKMKEIADQRGIQVFAFYGVGAQSLLTKFPVTKLADIQGKRFRVIPSPPRVGAYNDWGSIPRPMELGEVYSALQQGTVDGIENPSDVIYRMKLHEAARYYTLTLHSAFVNALIFSKKWFDGLSKDLQDVVLRTARETIVFGDEANTKAQVEGLEGLKKDAIVTRMPEAEIQKMKDLNRAGIWKKMRDDPQRGAIVKLLEEDIATYFK
ncbi:MAG: TRAP transporter substrate-binding protein [Betaproteobacteria bacterium]|nr:TRAP transporter substrate-binding protein [Betaproteobacteria bacterium]MBI2959966.1 TRAP transporter substrate-binding protein [Betaproteobacteria bacterium]